MLMQHITDQLSLKLIERQDADVLYALIDANREHLREWLGWVDGATGPDVYRDEIIPAWLTDYANGNGFACGIYFEGELVGTIALHEINQKLRQTSIGYYLTGNGRGQGLMTTVVAFITNYCFTTLDLNRVVIECAVGNNRSRKIPERLGYQQEGILRDAEKLYGAYHDIAVYAMLARDWSYAAIRSDRQASHRSN
ncbi:MULTISPECIES: GNAT family N-acetyltransferase [Exiguobacterium]|uniref:GNAT family N-acetyltransferase n=1 Tax=Exiguobacterium TaxID=33986 RepID=UPI001AEA0FF9|nr:MULTISPECIES: GNAT family protein [Exiguobacterium]MCT4780413.1 GNAT family N-acetyltransferase [Exiguobacterium soli]